MAKTQTTSTLTNAFAKAFNPLRGLTQSGINALIENVRRGNDVKLQVAFAAMEQATPIFGICLNKRLNGITNRQWDIVPADDSAEAKAQADTVKKMFLKSDTRNLDGLTEAMRHLGIAAFRGRSCVKPFFDENDDLYFKKVQNWNTLEWNDKLYWNPDADQGISFADKMPDLQQLTDDEVCWLKDERPIDIPGLQVYLRQLVGEENWARFVEKEGVPQVVITAPDGTPDNVLDTWNARAIALFEGGSGVLPSGAQVQQLTAARGQDPFSAYCDHQLETIVLLALGEKMTTLGGAAGLGSNLAEVQSQEFADLVSYDCKRIANTMTRCAVAKCVKKMFGDQPILCRFQFVEQDNIEPSKYLEMAKSAKDMGLKIDIQKLKELTKLSFISEEEADLWTPDRKEEQETK